MMQFEPSVFDADGDGRLSRHEFKCALTAAFGFRPHRCEIRRTCRRLGADGTISCADAADFVRRRSPQRDAAVVKQIWEAFDVDAQGFLTLAQLRAVFQETCASIPPETVEAAFHELDVGRTGKIGYHHFEMLVRRARTEQTAWRPPEPIYPTPRPARPPPRLDTR